MVAGMGGYSAHLIGFLPVECRLFPKFFSSS
jgi:hypothetical protein